MKIPEEKLLSKGYEFADVEKKWLENWKQSGCFAATMEEGKPAFSIVIPPPNVTGVLHVGHALNNTLQDILIRYHRMCGDNTLWVPGTDHAGIATQNVVERQLAEEGKTRDDLGRETFIEKVWEWRREKGGRIINQLQKLGASCDWERERFTMDDGLSQAVREVFVRLYREGLIYKGDYIVNWCPRCHTALADDEVEHEEQSGKLYHIRYPYADGSGEVVVATTRPETMLGDTGVAVHPDDERYRHLADIGLRLPLTDRVIPVVFDQHVDREFGTGALKVTPSHDRNDYEIGLRHSLPRLKVIDDKGIMNHAAGSDYCGLDRFACRKKVVEDLDRLGFLVRVEEHQHAVGHCYRCKTVSEPTTSLQWFVAVRPLADKAVAAVRDGRIAIHPKSWYNTFFNWMDNIRDWCISRQIWWGHRIPAWTCADCGALIVESSDPVSCPTCASTSLTQETDVLDTWFSSALWPFSTMGWPQPTRELATFYPTAVLITSFDILFFWVARMMMMGLHFMDEVPFRDVYLHALVRDKHGKKMSKSTGNVIDPLAVMAEYGTDAMRFTLTAFAAQGREIKLDEERIEGYRHFINKLWNAARFAQMHVAECQPSTEVALKPKELPLVHRWILSRTATLIREVRLALDEYRFNDAASANYQFIWREFCDWYLEWIKADLFADNQEAQDQARGVLLTVLETVLKLMHPITPFVTEEIWSVLPGQRELLAISSFPVVAETWTDDGAVEEMELLMGIITGIRNIRAEAEVHPSQRIEALVLCADPLRAKAIEAFTAAISDMTRLSALTVRGDGARPTDAATYIYKDIEIFVPIKGLVDVAAELARIARERGKVEAKLNQVNGKLANERFLANARAEVIAGERAKKAELDARMAKLLEAEERLRRMA